MQFDYIKNGATLSLNSEKCIGCGRCVEVCPHQVMNIEQRKAQIVNRAGCMECGACQKNCPVAALTVNAGVGCAYALLKGYLTKSAPSCGCSSSSCC